MERSGSIPEGSRIEFKMEGEQNNLSEISFPIYESDRALSVDTVELYQWITRNPSDNEDKAS